MTNKIYPTPDLFRLNNRYAGKEITRFENDVFGERFGIITEVIEDSFSQQHCAVILWENDEDITFDSEGYEVVEDFCPVHVVQVDLLKDGIMYEVHHGV